MDVIVTPDYQALSEAAAREVVRCMLAKPESVVLLPTGNTPKGMYAALARLVAEGLAELSSVTVFNLDEYLELDEDDERTFRRYMMRHLWDRIPDRPAAWYIPSSRPEDVQAECAAFEGRLGASGGADLAVLGIGENGHIAFIEPGTPWELGTHVAELAPETRRGEVERFGGMENVPHRAITVGAKTIMRARRVLLLASGAAKAEVLHRALAGPVTPDVPASVLQLHPRLTVMADREAGSRFG